MELVGVAASCFAAMVMPVADELLCAKLRTVSGRGVGVAIAAGRRGGSIPRGELVECAENGVWVDGVLVLGECVSKLATAQRASELQTTRAGSGQKKSGASIQGRSPPRSGFDYKMKL